MDGVFALLGLCGAALVLACTWRYGVGTSPEVAGHLSAARSLIAGKGYLCPDGGLYTQSPLFPTLLALPALLAADLLVAAQFLNALAFGLIVFFSGRLFLRCTSSRAFAVIGTLSILLSRPLLAVSVMVWPEPLLILLSLLFVLSIASFLRRQDWTPLLLSSLFAALAALQTRTGVMLIPAGLLLLVFGMHAAPPVRRVASLAVFMAISAPGPVAWRIRNQIATERIAAGNDWQSLIALGPGQSLRLVGNTAAGWLFPETASLWANLTGVTIILLAASVAVLVAMRARFEESGGMRRTQIGSAAVAGVLYLGFLVGSGAALPWEVGQRVVAPLYVFVMLLLVVGVDDASAILSRRFTEKELAASLSLAVAVVWLLYPLSIVGRRIEFHIKHGAGGYTTATWRESPLLEWFRANRPEGTIYSNAPDALYILTGTSVETAPRHDDFDAFRRRVSSSSVSHVVWSDRLRRNMLYDLQEIVSRYQTTKVAAFPDGAVYRLDAEGGAGVSAVYRFWSPRTNRHYYTMSRAERDKLIDRHGRSWTYEGPAFHVFPEPAPGTRPVHALRSTASEARFFTISEAEKESLQANHRAAWTHEGVAFHAWPEPQAENTVPVYRLWSRPLASHFYTASRPEKDRLLTEHPDLWTDEGIAWYAYKR